MKIFYLILILSQINQIFSWNFFNNFFTKNQDDQEEAHHEIKTLFEPEKTLTIMLNPAGDASYSGRIIDDYYERGITLACIQQIKQILEEKNPNLKILLTRSAGESKEQIDNISFANRSNINFYFSLHFYFNNEERHKIWLYHMLYHPTTDYWFKKQEKLTFSPYNMVHCLFLDESKQIGNILLDFLKKNENKFPIKCEDLIGLPFKPLLGLSCPAIACEISLSNKDNWKDIVPCVAFSLQEVISHLNNNIKHE